MNNILLGIFFLILGLLFANMLTNVCGCRDLVEGQCNTEANCVWNFNECLPKDEFLANTNVADAAGVKTYLDTFCASGSQPILADDQSKLYSMGEITYESPWSDSNCCHNESPTPSADPSPGSYKLSCNNSEITFTQSQL